MEIDKKRKIIKIIIFSVILLVLAISFFFYFQYIQIKDYLNIKLSQEISKKIKRKITIESISYSAMEGIKLKKVCIKEKDGKTDFFCFDKAKIKLETIPTLKGKTIFSDVLFSDGKIIIKKNNNEWNFIDLIELLPKNNKPIHLNWNAKNFYFNNFNIFISFPNGNEIFLEKANIDIYHRSETGGNFEFNIKSSIMTNINKNFISGDLKANYNLNFEYAILDFIKGNTNIDKIVLNDITAKNIEIYTEVFNLKDKKENRKFEFNISLSDLLIPSSNKIYDLIKNKTNFIEKIFGTTIHSQTELYIKNINLFSKYENRKIINSFEINSNLLYLLFKNNIDIEKSKHILNLKMKNNNKGLEIKSDSKLSKPEITPSISETADKYLKEGILNLENFILKFTIGG